MKIELSEEETRSIYVALMFYVCFEKECDERYLDVFKKIEKHHAEYFKHENINNLKIKQGKKMNLERIKEILKTEIETYKSWKDRKDIDSDNLCYDEAWTLFKGLNRAECQEIFEELIK